IEATADHCVCNQDKHEQHRAKCNRYVNPIDQVEVHLALLLPRLLQARHLLGNKALDDPVRVPNLIMYAITGGDKAELARGRRKSGFDLLQRIFMHAAEHDKTHLLTEPIEAAELIEDAIIPQEVVGGSRQIVAIRTELEPRIRTMIIEIALDDPVLQHTAERDTEAARRPRQLPRQGKVGGEQHCRSKRNGTASGEKSR